MAWGSGGVRSAAAAGTMITKQTSKRHHLFLINDGKRSTIPATWVMRPASNASWSRSLIQGAGAGNDETEKMERDGARKRMRERAFPPFPLFPSGIKIILMVHDEFRYPICLCYLSGFRRNGGKEKQSNWNSKWRRERLWKNRCRSWSCDRWHVTWSLITKGRMDSSSLIQSSLTHHFMSHVFWFAYLLFKWLECRPRCIRHGIQDGTHLKRTLITDK